MTDAAPIPDVQAGRPSDTAVAELLLEVLRRTHLSTAAELAEVVADQAASSLGAHDVVLYLVDYERSTLIPLPSTHATEAEPQSVAGSVAGRTFAYTTIIRTSSEAGGRQRLWLPLLDGTERLGAMEMSFDAAEITEHTIEVCERYAHLTAMLVATKAAYSDYFDRIRRRRPATVAAELSRALAPPLVFATDGVILGGMLEPVYDNGGDAFDYAINARILHLAVFDAMGHGLAAAGVAAFAISAYRNSRLGGHDLVQTYTTMDAAVGEQFPDRRFVTAVIAELDLDTGILSWVSAGHPPPLLIRDARHARNLVGQPATPLGVEFDERLPAIARESLEPGDMLLFYSDGLTEARTTAGEMFGLEGLTKFIEREAAAGQPAPETLRRLRQTLLGRERAQLRDDATALLVEWRRDSERRFMPETVV